MGLAKHALKTFASIATQDRNALFTMLLALHLFLGVVALLNMSYMFEGIEKVQTSERIMFIPIYGFPIVFLLVSIIYVQAQQVFNFVFFVIAILQVLVSEFFLFGIFLAYYNAYISEVIGTSAVHMFITIIFVNSNYKKYKKLIKNNNESEIVL